LAIELDLMVVAKSLSRLSDHATARSTIWAPPIDHPQRRVQAKCLSVTPQFSHDRRASAVKERSVSREEVFQSTAVYRTIRRSNVDDHGNPPSSYEPWLFARRSTENGQDPPKTF
jgi:hypothetical protein